MKKKVFIVLSLSMLLGGYSLYETKSSTSLLISENIEALTEDGDSPENAIALGKGWKYVEMYQSDSSGNGPKKITHDAAHSSQSNADRKWYKRNGKVAHKCSTWTHSATSSVIGYCFDYNRYYD